MNNQSVILELRQAATPDYIYNIFIILYYNE